jgi:DNA modification methylase
MTAERTLADLEVTDQYVQTPTEDLHVDGDNPNEQADETYGHFLDGMRSGWVGGPIVANTSELPGYDGDPEGLICDGEHRWRAAQDIGRDTVPVTFVDFVDDAERRYWRQHLNKVTGDHDPVRDALEYDQLLAAGYTDEVDALTDAANEDLDELLAEIRMDNGVEPAYEYDSEHTVYFEDCVEGMRERVADDSIDMVFTSPPYNVDINEGFRYYEKQGETVNYDVGMDDDEFRELLRDCFQEIARVVKPGGHVFINFQNDIREGVVKPPVWVADAMPLPWRSFIVWDKGTGASLLGRLHTHGDGVYSMNWEPILHFSTDTRPLNGSQGETVGVWQIPSSNREFTHDTGNHPAPFPVALVDKAIRTATTEGDTVLDPFMGSGTTAVAAIEANRSYVGFELDEDGAYKPIIERRIGDAKRQREAAVNKTS